MKVFLATSGGCSFLAQRPGLETQTHLPHRLGVQTALAEAPVCWCLGVSSEGGGFGGSGVMIDECVERSGRGGAVSFHLLYRNSSVSFI